MTQIMQPEPSQTGMLESGKEIAIVKILRVQHGTHLDGKIRSSAMDVLPSKNASSSRLSRRASNSFLSCRERSTRRDRLLFGGVNLPYTKLRCTRMYRLESVSLLPN